MEKYEGELGKGGGDFFFQIDQRIQIFFFLRGKGGGGGGGEGGK